MIGQSRRDMANAVLAQMTHERQGIDVAVRDGTDLGGSIDTKLPMGTGAESAPQAPHFAELFPTLPVFRHIHDDSNSTDNLWIVPTDSSARVILPPLSETLPIHIGGATSTNFLRLTSEALTALLGKHIVITDVRPLALVPCLSGHGLVVSARILRAAINAPASDATEITQAANLFDHRWKPIQRLITASLQDHPGGPEYYDAEIVGHNRMRARYLIHRVVVRRIRSQLARFQPFLSTEDLSEILVAQILERLRCGLLIDVACGDNALCTNPNIIRKASCIVRNDVSASMGLARQKFDRVKAPVITTCIDARMLPFKAGQFDVSLCRNVLHHMPTHQDALTLLGELTRISRAVILCEILDPLAEEGRWGRLRHYYYRKYLPDDGDRFLTSLDFDELVSALPESKIVRRRNYTTINGVYACAILSADKGVDLDAV